MNLFKLNFWCFRTERSGVFIDNFEHIAVYVSNFEHAIVIEMMFLNSLF